MNCIVNYFNIRYNYYNRRDKMVSVLTEKELKNLNYYWMATNYLSVCQLYLWDNVLLKRSLTMDDVKPKIVGHWGTAPGQNFIYAHLNRIIKKYDLNMMYISGPGHGGEAMIANSYLEEVYSKVYPEITLDEKGLTKLCRRFSFPGGVSSHVAPDVPGSINEGGELGYSLSHAYGACLDNKDLIVSCVIGDGEAETGPLSASWNINKLINPKVDGMVLPILHLNGYKISNPTVMGRMSDKELVSLFTGYGYKPYIVSGDDPRKMHEKMAYTLEKVLRDINKVKLGTMKNFPMIILRSPKGWGCPKKIKGKEIEGSFRSHQVPITIDSLDDLKILEKWLRSYKPDKLFDNSGRLNEEIRDILPRYEKRMSVNKHANGGLLLEELNCPNFRDYAISVRPGKTVDSDMTVLGGYVRDLVKLNSNKFKIFGPDEALSNRLTHVFEVTDRKWNGRHVLNDEFLSKNGSVIDSILSEHVCEGMLEGYLLTGRHGFMHSYEAFIRIVDSMVSQHAKWLKITKDLTWRAPISSLNFVLTSHIWQQDHNGYTHQDPGFLNHVATKKASISRIYLPIDANTLLSTFDHCIKTKDYINVIVASKHPRFQWLSMDEATVHCKKGIGELSFISDKCDDPDLVLVSSGDTPTIEVVAAKKIIDKFLNIKTRVINVIDLMRLQSNLEHPHGLSDDEYDKLFTKNKPIIFAFHGYPNLIHMLCYKRKNKNMHVHGYKEEGTITTPFDMRVQNELDRYHLVLNAIKYLKISKEDKKNIQDYCINQLNKHYLYIRKHGVDMPDVDKLI